MIRIRWNELVFGKPRDPTEPTARHSISLIAFLAWVGLGADGLSSACYGPEETFKALGEHRELAPFLVLAIVATVSILSAAYAGTIQAFPAGGGGYSVATRTLGRWAGMICGCALVLDYVLTVGISLAAGADAIFSLLPVRFQFLKVWAALLGVALLMLLNFRGVKESVLVMLPVFFLFLVTHAALIVLALVRPGPAVAPTPQAAAAPLAGFAAFVLVLKAYSHGAGTYTGIEAISNSLTILREPRVRTARRAMLYMAVSLAVVAGGLLWGYHRMHISEQEGRTFNALLAAQAFAGFPGGDVLAKLALASEALLLVIAAQAGFTGGPRVVASMAVDSWVPRWFSRLNDRLSIWNGILLIGLGAAASIVLTGGRVQMLVIIYSFCVFVTFLLSQTGMTRYWTTHREPGWGRRAAISLTAALLSLLVLGALLATYGVGTAGLALAAILALALFCALARLHYASVGRALGRLQSLIGVAEADPHRGEPTAPDRDRPTAVLLVSGYNGMGMHLLLALQRVFPDFFKQAVFVSIGTVDYDRFKGEREIENLRSAVTADLDRYVALVRRWGFAAEARMAMGVDATDELEELCASVMADYPRAVFFCGDVIFQIPTFLTGLFHERTAEHLLRRFHLRGMPLLVLPIRVGSE